MEWVVTKKTPVFAMNITHPTLPAPPHSSHPISLLSTSPILMATMVYLFLVQQLSNPGPKASFTLPQALQHWSNPPLCQIHVMKSQKSCLWWTLAIIQQLWHTAWDLIAHQNVESPVLGSGLPTTRGLFILIHSPCTEAPVMAHTSIVIWQNSKFSNPAVNTAF